MSYQTLILVVGSYFYFSAKAGTTTEHMRRGGRAVEGARLESVYTCKRIEGSNPFLSAIDSTLIRRTNCDSEVNSSIRFPEA